LPGLDSFNYRAIFHSPESIAFLVIAADDFRIVETNNAAERLYGYGPEEMRGMPVAMLSAEPELTNAMLTKTLAGLRDLPARRIHLKKDGTRFPVSVATSVSNMAGRTYLCKFVQDATQLEQTEQELVRSDARFRAIADYTYDWESWLDMEGKPVWVNPAVERFTGYTADRCVAMPDYPLRLVASDSRAKVQGIIADALQGSTGNDVKFQAIRNDGSVKWIAESWQPLRDDRKAQVGVRMSMRDIDERKAMEKQLKLYVTEMEKLAEVRARRIVKLEQEKAHIEKLASLGELAASVAHEISNPLAGIKNALRLVIDATPPGGDSAELLRLVDQEIARITALLRQMYQLYRPRTERPSPIDLDAVIRDVLLLNDGARTTKNLKIVFENRFGPTRPLLPEIEFRQILQNLLLNAIEASYENGSIEIRARRSAKGELGVSVTDHGHGIPPELIHQIFEPFFTTRCAPGKTGSGLGLAISRSLAQAMGGTITVRTSPIGGTSFELLVTDRTSPIENATESASAR